jgi:hypothetical protein
MKCNACNKSSRGSFKYCPDCGAEFSGKSTQVSENFSGSDFGSYKPDATSKKAMKPKLVALIAVILAVGAVNAFVLAPKAKQPVEDSESVVYLSSVLSDAEIVSTSEKFCKSANGNLEALDVKQYLKDAKTNLASVKKGSKDAWSSAEWAKKNPSWFSGENYSTQVENNIKATISHNSYEVFMGLGNKSITDGFKDYSARWENEIYDEVLESCGLYKTVKALKDYDGYLNLIAIQKDQIPWYPKGFTEISGFSDFAYKASGANCSYSFGSCAVFKLVSVKACPTNLYVEANLLRNGEVVAWGNDTARVRSLQVSNMEISFSSDNGDSWEFTRIECY